MTEPRAPGHQPSVGQRAVTFEAIYEQHFAFVWRTLRRLGVGQSALDDATQEVFLVVYRRLRDFEGRASVRTWVAGVAIKVAATHRRTLYRRGQTEPVEETLVDPRRGPHDSLARSEAVATLEKLLRELDDKHREVFVLVQLEQLTAPEIAEALGINLNTVYSRLRTARALFEAALARSRSTER